MNYNGERRSDATKLEMFLQRTAAGFERVVTSSVFNQRLTTGSNGYDEPIGGKLFQTPAAAAGRAMFEYFDRGITSSTVIADRSSRREQ